MAVMRVNKTTNYTVMSKHHLRENDMSLKAKGLLSVMLSLPNDWDYSIAGLVAICKENETAIKSTLNELQKFGYLQITKLLPCKEENRTRIEYVYDVFECPQKGKKQGTENLALEPLALEERRQLNTNKLNTNKLNTNYIISNDTKKEEVVEKIPKSEHERVRHKIDKLQISNELRSAILKYMKHRLASGRPITTVYLDIMLKQLEKNSNGDEQTKIKIIEQSIINGYRELYPLKGNNTFNSKNRSLEVGASYSVNDYETFTGSNDYYDNLMNEFE